MTDSLRTANGHAYAMVSGEAPLHAASDGDLAARGFDRDVTFNGGVLRATGAWSTPRGLSVLDAGGTIDTQDYDVAIGGGTSGNGTLVKRGKGTLRLNGLGTHSSTWLAAGTLIVTGAHVGRIALGPDGLLAGTGAVREVDASAGTIMPGDDAPGLLLMNAITMGREHELVVRIAGLLGGRDYDRLDVRDTATIDGATLTLRPATRMPRRSRFKIVTNAVGQFARLPEGALIPTAFGIYQITYRGGPERRDVVLIAR